MSKQEAAATAPAPVAVRCIAEGWTHADTPVAIDQVVEVGEDQAKRVVDAGVAKRAS